MVDPFALIEVARTLASQPNPSPEALRRAISTAYYAVFHGLAASAADRFVGAGDTSPAYALFYRALDHTRVRLVFIELNKSSLKASYRQALRRTAVSQDIRDFADIFVPLQELRHLADYNPFALSLSRPGVIDLIENAALALKGFASQTVHLRPIFDVRSSVSNTYDRGCGCHR